MQHQVIEVKHWDNTVSIWRVRRRAWWFPLWMFIGPYFHNESSAHRYAEYRKKLWKYGRQAR